MIKVHNQKSLKEIQELREKGLYQAPFTLLANMDVEGLKVEAGDNTELLERIEDMEMYFDELGASLYEAIGRVEEYMSESILEVYETVLEVQ